MVRRRYGPDWREMRWSGKKNLALRQIGYRSERNDITHATAMQTGEESTRQLKVARQVQRDLSEIFRLGAREYCQGRMVTVTRVRVSSDLEYAHAYLSIFPSGNAEEVVQSIAARAREIRYQLGKRVGKQLRVVPELTFALDDSLDYIENIDRLLKADSKENPDG